MQKSSQQTILLIRAGALGDCLLMLPTLHALRAHYPEARIDVMGYPSRWEWVLGRGLVDSVQAIDRPGMHLLFSDGSEVPTALKAFLGGYDVILSYRPDADGVFERSLCALGARTVLSQPPFPPPPPPKIHAANFALQLVARIGVPVPPAGSGLDLSDAERALVQPFFSTHDVDLAHQSIVVVHPGSGSAAKRWPVENFATLIETLEGQRCVRTVIVTGYAEADVAAELRSLIPSTTLIVAENWPLIPTMALIGHATVFVGHDSGLTHLAAALRRPTVAIFGPTDPEIWGPRGEYVTVVRMESAYADAKRRRPTQSTFQPAQSDLQRVLEAVQRWLVTKTPRRSLGDRLGQS